MRGPPPPFAPRFQLQRYTPALPCPAGLAPHIGPADAREARPGLPCLQLEGAESKARAARSHASEWELLAAGRAAEAAEARQRSEELEGRLGEALRELEAERAAREVGAYGRGTEQCTA